MPDHPSLDAVAAGGFDQSVDGSPMRSGRVDSDPTIDSLSARERDGADMVFVLPVFTAGEAPIQGFDADHLVEGLRAHGHRHAVALADNDALASALGEVVEAGDIVVCMGAGNITAIAHELPARLAEAAA